MSVSGWYYLHENGDLIWKKFEPKQEPGGFVRKVWSMDTADRSSAWTIAIEALANGAREDRVLELASKWGLTDEDAHEFASRTGVILGVRCAAGRTAHSACFRPEADPANPGRRIGLGASYLEAMAELARQNDGSISHG